MSSYLYLAGPMTKYADTHWNYPAFRQAAAYLRSMDFEILNPAENFHGRTDLPREAYLDLAVLQVASRACSGVVRLPDWQQSSGARMEVAIAEAYGKDIFDYQELVRNA